MAKIFNIPFATTGDREPIPQESQEDNHVSYAEGYTEEYGLDPATSADALDIERAKFNGLVHDITEAIFELQRHGVALWSADAAPYPAKARVYHSGAVWSSPSGNNNQVPGEGSGWVLNEVIFSTEAQALLGEDGGTAMSPLRTHQAFNQYGLGVKQKNVFTGDVRTLDAEGSYRVGPAATRTPSEVPGTLVVRVLDPDNRTLVFVGQGASPTIYYTQLRGGVWDIGWHTVWSSQNQLALGKTAEAGRTALELGTAATKNAGKDGDLVAASAGMSSVDLDFSATDYAEKVIGLVRLEGEASLNSFASYMLFVKRGNGSIPPSSAVLQAAKRYDSYDMYGSILSVVNSSNMPFELVRFRRGGEWWGGVRFYHDNAGPTLVRLTGTGTDSPFFEAYYNRQTSTVLNQEIYDSITTDGVVPVGPLRFNGTKVGGTESVAQVSASRTLVADDAGAFLDCTAAAGLVLTVPSNTLPVNAVVLASHGGTSGAVEFVAGAGVSLEVPEGTAPRTRAVGSTIGIVEVARGRWRVFGDLDDA